MSGYIVTTRTKQDRDQKPPPQRNPSCSDPKLFEFNRLDESSIARTAYHPSTSLHHSFLAAARSNDHRVAMALALQQSYGNRYLQKLMRKSRLTLNTPGDVYEKEADRVSEGAVRQLSSQRPPDMPEENIQTSPVVPPSTAGLLPGVSPKIEDQINTARPGGGFLDNSVRIPMEKVFGADFSGVRVHTDSNANVLNRSLQARAFTTGNDIFFKSGEYNPQSSSGQKLIAHELTHVIQQGSAAELNLSGQEASEITNQPGILHDSLTRSSNKSICRAPEMGSRTARLVKEYERRMQIAKGLAEETEEESQNSEEQPERNKENTPQPEENAPVSESKPPRTDETVSNSTRDKPPVPKKTYYLEKPKELVETGGNLHWYSSQEYRHIVERTEQYYQDKVNSPNNFKEQASAVSDLLNTIAAWWKKYWLFSRKSRRDALTTLEGWLKREISPRLIPWMTAKHLVSGGTLEKHDPQHREGMILEYCFSRWPQASKYKKKGSGLPPSEFYDFVSSLEQSADQKLMTRVHSLVFQKIGEEGADNWIKEHEGDKKYIPRIVYVPKEEFHRRKLKFSGKKDVVYESTNQPLVGNKDYIYVLSPDGEFYAEEETRQTQLHFHHSSLLAGEEVASAGHLKTGNMIYLDLESGHYQPNMQNMYNAVKALKDKNVDLNTTLIKPTYEADGKIIGRYFLEGITGMKAGKSEEDETVKKFIIQYIQSRYGFNYNITDLERAAELNKLREEVRDLRV